MRTIPRGEAIPVGLSKWEDLAHSGYQLRLPVFAWHRTGYDVTADLPRIGWWAFDLLLKTEPNGFNAHLGWTLLKQTRQAWNGPRP